MIMYKYLYEKMKDYHLLAIVSISVATLFYVGLLISLFTRTVFEEIVLLSATLFFIVAAAYFYFNSMHALQKLLETDEGTLYYLSQDSK